MKTVNDSQIVFKLPTPLKKKFNIATWFLDMSTVLQHYVQDYVREHEKQYWIIPIRWNKNDQYNIIAKMYWMEIKEERMEELKKAYSKTRTGVGIYGN